MTDGAWGIIWWVATVINAIAIMVLWVWLALDAWQNHRRRNKRG